MNPKDPPHRTAALPRHATTRVESIMNQEEPLRIHTIRQAAGLDGALRLLGAALLLATLALASTLLWKDGPWPVALALVSLFSAALALLVIRRRLATRILHPLARLEESLTRVCQGEPGASDRLREPGVLERIEIGRAHV